MLNAIAIIVLAGMMLIPGINLLVGIVAGGASFGVSGAFAGGAIAVLITLAEKWLSDGRRMGPTQPRPTAEIFSFPEPSLWQPVPAFDENVTIAAALRKLAADAGPGYAGAVQHALAS
jgi:ABC-type branched-subunit amino acid transport system permease subunit